MSSETLPITPAAFAEAIKELTLPVLYAKVAELRNSIAHLQRSNLELRQFITESCESEEDQRELAIYVLENEQVKKSMDERIRLCKAEIEGRGSAWIELDLEPSSEREREGAQGDAQEQTTGPGATATPAVNGTGTGTNAPSTDRSRDREGDGGDDGVYL
ncbi:uncharacterized protein BDV14DRAFT_196285 [Aspergillus stella-maris]|uniref:uncharacterized protein n=1 Tax=Aspergillus stella-maris TaxID=1810926 RepID=UPI003CCCB6E2